MPFDPDHSPQSRKLSFAILGTGFSGLCMAIKLREAEFDDFTIYEKADEVGGTWRENTYPGVACDVPSHLYSFSFAPNPNWTKRFSPGEEIWDYMKACAERYDLYRSIEFGKQITAAIHEGDKWRIDFADGSSARADFVISGLGGLHEPNMPDIPGQEEFAGPSFHTAKWRHDVDLSNKRVAIIGSAASAVQVVPEIAPIVAHLDVYQRTPNWIMRRESYEYPNWAKKLFARFPFIARAYRGFYFSLLEWRFGAFKAKDNYVKRFIRKAFVRHMEQQVEDSVLRAKLTPDYPVGCKRILISDDYLPALQRDNVDLVTEPIEAIAARGVRTKDGKERAVDVLIYATGFKPFDILESISVVGPSGLSLKEKWKDEIAAHRTVAAPGFPNFFMLLGPNSGLGHNSVILMIEAQVDYVIKLVRAAAASGAMAIEPDANAAKAYDRQIQNKLQKRVWAADCGAWYVDEHGRNYTLYPNSVRAYLREMNTPRLDEYKLMPADASIVPQPEAAPERSPV